MLSIASIRDAIRRQHVRITDHADEEAQADRLSFGEITFSVMHGEVIEDYPDDRPYPSCPVLGRTQDEFPIHSVWAYNTDNQWAVLVTVYRPDPGRWLGNWKTRRGKK